MGDDTDSFAKRLADARARSGMTQTQLAVAAGIGDAGTISRYEKGKMTNPGQDTLRRLGAALKMDWRQLVPPEVEPESEVAYERPRYPALTAFLESAEGRSVTPEELRELEGEQYRDGAPTELSYHFKLAAVRARAKGKSAPEAPPLPPKSAPPGVMKLGPAKKGKK